MSRKKLVIITTAVLVFLLFNSPLTRASTDTGGENGNKNIRVTFRVNTTPLPFHTTVHITGNHEKLLNRNYPYVPMKRISESTWEKQFTFEKGTRLEYQFNLGSIHCSGKDQSGTVLPVSTLAVEKDTVVSADIPAWRRGEIHFNDWNGSDDFTRELWVTFWKFHPGDNPEWANPDYDDSEWELVDPELDPEDFPESGWEKVNWFRVDIYDEKGFPGDLPGIRGYHGGKIKIYWDGELVTDRLTYIPVSLKNKRKEKHTLAVRYERENIKQIHEKGRAAGFYIVLGKFYPMSHLLLEQKSEQMLFTGLCIAFAFLHLLLFIYSPEGKGNLYYSLLLFLFAAMTYVDIQLIYMVSDNAVMLTLQRVQRAIAALTPIVFLRFCYSLFYKKCPRIFWGFAFLFLVVGVVIVQNPRLYDYYVYLGIVMAVEVFRVNITAIKRKKDGAWIFAAGTLVFFLFNSYDTLLDLRLIDPVGQMTNAYYFGYIGLFVASSNFLARDFSRTHQRFLAQERRAREEEFARKLIEADNERKTKELQEARDLQLSMLPGCIDNLKDLEICFSMRPATEVGGDYYDYVENGDGSLTIAAGDATGHGMKAGTMVSLIKGLFITNAAPGDPVSFLSTCSRTIKRMKMGNLYMALMLVNIKGNRLTVSSAGMPPLLIYRAGQDKVEEITIKSPPLGGIKDFPYKSKETRLNKGDTVMLLSDGLPELFNEEDEMMGYQKVKELFKNAAASKTHQISEALIEEAGKWRQSREQDDDMTFVVIRYRGD